MFLDRLTRLIPDAPFLLNKFVNADVCLLIAGDAEKAARPETDLSKVENREASKRPQGSKCLQKLT